MKKSLFVLIVTIVVLEVGMRAILGLGRPLLYSLDPIYGYFPAPNQHLRRFFATIETNNFGMRSKRISEDKSALQLRLLILGDSIAFGNTYVDQEKIFSSRLQSELGNRVEVLNVSAGGWSVENEANYVRKMGIFESDRVFMVINTNDLDQQFSPIPDSQLFPSTSPYFAMSELLQRYILPKFFKSKSADPGSLAVAQAPKIEIELNKIISNIDFVRKTCLRSGAKFSIVYSPSIQPNILRFRKDWDYAVNTLIAWAGANSVDFIDMRPLFLSQDADKIYFDGIHLKPFAHELIAKKLMREYYDR